MQLGASFAALVLGVLVAGCDGDDSPSSPTLGTDGGTDGGGAFRTAVPFKPSLVAEAVEAAYARGDLAGVGDLVIDQNCGANPNALVRVGEASVCGGNSAAAKFLYVAQPGSAAPPTGPLPYDLPAPIANAPPTLAVLVAKNIRLAPGKLLYAQSGSAIVLFALESITIEGTVDVGPLLDAGVRGAGAPPLNETTAERGAGLGGGRSANRAAKRAGAGGSFCGLGGGAMLSPTGSEPASTAYGTPELVPLLAGSDGGSGVGKGGAGGGAIALIAGRAITIAASGVITSPGTGGGRGDFGGGGTPGLGGGSGGAILLEAPTIDMNGVLAANGGGGGGPGAENGARGSSSAAPTTAVKPGGIGNTATSVNGTDGSVNDDPTTPLFGGGGGGAGRIRLNGTTVNVTGSVSPALTTTCGTKGALASW